MKLNFFNIQRLFIAKLNYIVYVTHVYFVTKLCTFVPCEALSRWPCLSVVLQFSECSNVVMWTSVGNCEVYASRCQTTRKKREIKRPFTTLTCMNTSPFPSLLPPSPLPNIRPHLSPMATRVNRDWGICFIL